MAKGSDVLKMLVPEGGWVITADDYDSIRWDSGIAPITKQQFLDGFSQADIWMAEQKTEAEAKREATLSKLAALGLDEDDLKALGLGGN